MEQRIITILGGTGFLGRYVVKELASAGYRLRIISRSPTKNAALKTAGDVGQISLISGDITNQQTYASAIKGSYAVINLVGILFESGKQTFTDTQSLGAERLASAAKAAGVRRFIHISALGVEHEAGSSYARSKFLGELAVMSAFPEATILRPSVIFGAEDNFFNKFAQLANIAPALPLIGGGVTKFQPVYVGDVARAVKTCLEREDTKGSTYELGGTKIYSFKEILEYILSVTGKKRFLLPLPFGVASIIGRIGEFIPTPPLTRDQVKLLRYNNVVSSNAKNFAHLGIVPTSVEAVVPEYLSMYQPQSVKKLAV